MSEVSFRASDCDVLRHYPKWRDIKCDLCFELSDSSGVFVWGTRRFGKIICRRCVDHLPPLRVVDMSDEFYEFGV
jgi:hypothetical protein